MISITQFQTMLAKQFPFRNVNKICLHTVVFQFTNEFTLWQVGGI